MDLLTKTNNSQLIEDNIYDITDVSNNIENIRIINNDDVTIEKLADIKNKYGNDANIYVPINLEKLQQEIINKLHISDNNEIYFNKNENKNKNENENENDVKPPSELISNIKKELMEKCIIKTTLEKYCSSDPDTLLESNTPQYNTYIPLNLNEFNEKTQSSKTDETSIQNLVNLVDEIVAEGGWDDDNCNGEDGASLPKILKTKYQLEKKNCALFTLKRFNTTHSNINQTKNLRPCIINESLNLDADKVHLRAIIIHSGSSINGGHYYALIVLNGKLFELNDIGQENYMEEREMSILTSDFVQKNAVLACYSHKETETRSEKEMMNLYAKNSNNNCYVHSLFSILYFIGIESIRNLFTQNTEECNLNILNLQMEIFSNNSQQDVSELLEKIGHATHEEYSKL